MFNTFNNRPQLSKSIERVLARYDQKSVRLVNGHDGWLWDSRQDVMYAHHNGPLANVLHIFHKEWHGIRAAAGSLPGRKLAIPETRLTQADLNALALDIQDANPERIVLHGFSDNMAVLMRSFRSAGLTDRIFLVFHGSPAQWWNEADRAVALEMIEMAQDGFMRGLHIMKNGMEVPGAPLFRPLLYNLSPVHRGEIDVPQSDRVSAFVPGWGTWIKNVFGSVYGASLSDQVEEVWAFASGLKLPSPLDDKLVILKAGNREETFKRYQTSHLTLNVSLIDCHPMVNVESQSLGRPCVRSNLYLDLLEDHEYVKIVSVDHNNSSSAVKDAVDRTLDVSQEEMSDMILDYQSKIDTLGVKRYIEFLEL
ncbi:hypothetical protein PK98_08835 [Croceibacterium mercuriale]|uniref:Uncharacterized protein n=1 Tax=Croceibacterium mercuriale TaxID=1572751 RepID=A0A0B2C397_9SPHN|nr:ABC transporter substrate-binding protein [Croceibacterium mercuriale]KHL26501.1 hypothetical protein PK98_08835 [Croceibacterium mercuriale]